MTDSLETINDWLRYVVSQFEQHAIFFGHGTDNSYDEAVWLVLSTLHVPFDRLNDFKTAKLLPNERQLLAERIQRRVEDRVPTAYLLQEAWLQGFKFYVDERVLVPRSFIAELMQTGFSGAIEYPELIQHAADICTGSGCLGVLLADAFPDALIDVVDISPDAIEVCNINIGNYQLEDRITAIQSDMFAALAGKQYDLIISNPPYVDAPSMATLPAEYRNEPQIALGSGTAGLDHTHTLLTQAANYLSDDGLLVVEIGHNKAVLEATYPQLNFQWLDCSSGADFVFLLTKQQLLAL